MFFKRNSVKMTFFLIAYINISCQINRQAESLSRLAVILSPDGCLVNWFDTPIDYDCLQCTFLETIILNEN